MEKILVTKEYFERENKIIIKIKIIQLSNLVIPYIPAKKAGVTRNRTLRNILEIKLLAIINTSLIYKKTKSIPMTYGKKK